MTCVAALVQGGTVYLGADSAATGGWDLTVRADPKVFAAGDMVMGFTSSFRMGQLLRHSFVPPPVTDGEPLHGYMCTEFVDAVRLCLKEGGWATKDKEQEQAGSFIVGVRGRLFFVCSDYQVGSPADDFFAIGCGDQAARGAMFATEGLGWPPRKRLKLALRAAERLSAGVRGPFTYAQSAGR